MFEWELSHLGGQSVGILHRPARSVCHLTAANKILISQQQGIVDKCVRLSILRINEPFNVMFPASRKPLENGVNVTPFS